MKKLLIILSLALLVSSCYTDSQIAETSCQLVTEILEEGMNEISNSNFNTLTKDMEISKCVAVELGAPLKKNIYNHATAYLENGSELEIMVEIRNDEVYVTLKKNPFLWFKLMNNLIEETKNNR